MTMIVENITAEHIFSNDIVLYATTTALSLTVRNITLNNVSISGTNILYALLCFGNSTNTIGKSVYAYDLKLTNGVTSAKMALLFWYWEYVYVEGLLVKNVTGKYSQKQ
jgi:hypothetical protein